MNEFLRLVSRVCEKSATLSRTEARLVLAEMMTGEAAPEQIARLLTAMASRGETAEELAGFAEQMRALSIPLPLTEAEQASLVDTCGTGGSGDGTFNISTAAALLATAAGAKIAKHGNRAVTSRCGSADVLEAMGIPVALTPEQSVACLRATGFTFLYAPALHPTMKRVMPIRRELGIRTIFNLAGPLTNPAKAEAQVMGVYALHKVSVVAEALALLKVRHALVVHGNDGLDELTLTTSSQVAEIRPDSLGQHKISYREVLPAEANLAPCDLAALQGADTVEGNAAILEKIFDGETGPRTQIALLNAAAALFVGGLVPNLAEGVARAAQALDSGAAKKTVEQLRSFGCRLDSTISLATASKP